MRLRLFLAFLLVVLVTAVGMVALASWRIRQDIGQFLYRGGLSGSSQLVEELEAHYGMMRGWEGVENLVAEHGAGQMSMQSVTLADAEGNILLVQPGHMGSGQPMGPGMMGQGPGQGQSSEPTQEQGPASDKNQGQGRQNQGQNSPQDSAPAQTAGPQQEPSTESAQIVVPAETTVPEQTVEPAQLSEEQIAEAIPLYDGGRLIGYLLPENPLRVPAGIENNLLDRLTRSALLASGIAALLSLILALLLATVLLRPVRDLTLAAAAMGRGDLQQRVRPSGSRETRLLAQTFNDMAGSLQQAEERRRALTADIAHELRNPLAIQRANLEALQDGLLPMTPDQLEPIFRQNVLLGNLVEDLRTLALADAGHLPLEIAQTDLALLVQRRVRDLEAGGAANSIRIREELPLEPVFAAVDPARIGQILTNLLSNALRHAPPGSEISVMLAQQAGRAVITVRDHGPGIAAEDLPYIFERFYRGDKARSRGSGSTGLGLSIARRLAEAHRGTLDAANHPEGGAVFTLTIPN